MLAYTGAPVLIDDLLYKPNSSLVRQAYAPQQLHMLNLGGFGIAAWDAESREPERPFFYRSTELPLWDRNLKALSEKIHATCVLAHIRGIPYEPDANFGADNLHPFRFEGCRWAMAHNGELVGTREIRPHLLASMPYEIAVQVRGSTDSELVYAAIMAELGEERATADATTLLSALERTLARIRGLRRELGIAQSSSLNLFFADGDTLVATRFTFDFGCYPLDPERIHENSLRYLSLWYTAGERYCGHDGEWRMSGDPAKLEAFILASEPLTRDVTGWVEVQEYSAVIVERAPGGLRIRTVEIDV